MSQTPSAEISRKNPLEDFELLQRIGSGTYGDVYKVSLELETVDLFSSLTECDICECE